MYHLYCLHGNVAIIDSESPDFNYQILFFKVKGADILGIPLIVTEQVSFTGCFYDIIIMIKCPCSTQLSFPLLKVMHPTFGIS